MSLSYYVRIDGGSEGATLLKTSMGEKETALVGLPTLLMPANELEKYNMDGEETRDEEEKWYEIRQQ